MKKNIYKKARGLNYNEENSRNPFLCKKCRKKGQKINLTFLKRASMQSTITFAYFVSSFAISVNVLITILLLKVRVTRVSLYFSATSLAIPVSLLPAILQDNCFQGVRCGQQGTGACPCLSCPAPRPSLARWRRLPALAIRANWVIV